jgi:hypothetical protein
LALQDPLKGAYHDGIDSPVQIVIWQHQQRQLLTALMLAAQVSGARCRD